MSEVPWGKHRRGRKYGWLHPHIDLPLSLRRSTTQTTPATDLRIANRSAYCFPNTRVDDPNSNTALCIVATRTLQRFRNPTETKRRRIEATMTRLDCATNETRDIRRTIGEHRRTSANIGQPNLAELNRAATMIRELFITGIRSWQPDLWKSGPSIFVTNIRLNEMDRRS